MLAKSAKKRDPEVTYDHGVELRALEGIARLDGPGARRPQWQSPAPWLTAGVEAQGKQLIATARSVTA